MFINTSSYNTELARRHVIRRSLTKLYLRSLSLFNFINLCVVVKDRLGEGLATGEISYTAYSVAS